MAKKIGPQQPNLRGLQAELDELERTDPEVRAAAERYEQTVWELTRRTTRKRFHPRPDGPPDVVG